MKITLELIKNLSVEDAKLIAKWDNDKDIQYLQSPNFGNKPLDGTEYSKFLKYFPTTDTKQWYFIKDGDEKIGYIFVDYDFFMLYKIEAKSTCWVSICIGEKEYWGKGASEKVFEILEDICRGKNIHRMELGVFSFNTRALKFYEKIGFKSPHSNASTS